MDGADRIEAVTLCAFAHVVMSCTAEIAAKMGTEKRARSRKSLWPSEMRLAFRNTKPTLCCVVAAFFKQSIAV